MARKIDDTFAVMDRRGKTLRLAGRMGRPLMLDTYAIGKGRYGDGLPFLFAERPLSKLEAYAHDMEPMPGVWYQDPTDYVRNTSGFVFVSTLGHRTKRAPRLRGDGEKLTQLETDLMIVAELYKAGTREDQVMLERLAGPRILWRKFYEGDRVTVCQQRGGQHSDPLIRVAAARAFWDRDFVWGIKCQEPSCELPRYHKEWHTRWYWMDVSCERRLPSVNSDAAEEWREGRVHRWSGDPRESSYDEPTWTELHSNGIRVVQDPHATEPMVFNTPPNLDQIDCRCVVTEPRKPIAEQSDDELLEGSHVTICKVTGQRHMLNEHGDVVEVLLPTDDAPKLNNVNSD